MSSFATTPPAAGIQQGHRVEPAGLVPSPRPPAVAIVGAGFSGTLLALHLLRHNFAAASIIWGNLTGVSVNY